MSNQTETINAKTNVSVLLPFQSISNIRDMAGIENREGRLVKKGCLFRSASLHHASDLDLNTLEGLGLSDVVDLRTSAEVMMEPDRLLPSMALHNFHVLTEKDGKKAAGSDEQMVKEAVDDLPLLLEQLYREMISSKSGQKAWRDYFDVLLDAKGGVLWHCTQGKDRTGIAAALLLLALDVAEESVLADYLSTNAYLKDQYEAKKERITGIFGTRETKMLKDLEAYMTVRPEYFAAAKDEAVKGWGSWQGYLTEALGVDDNKRERLKEKYLFQPED